MYSSNWLNALFCKEEILFSLISEVTRQNLTTLGSTHHFLQGTAQVSAACQPFRCLGLSHSFVEYKGSLWKFFRRDKEFFTCPPRLGFVLVWCPATGSIPFPFPGSHEEQVVSLSGSPSSEAPRSSEQTLHPRLL